MKGPTTVLFLLLPFLVLFLIEARSVDAKKKKKNGVYIVYMGSAVSANGSLRNDHTLLLNSVLQRRKNALVRSYSHGFCGFAARLSAAEAQSIEKKPGVVSVFPDKLYELHTTRSWDFLKYLTEVDTDSNSNPIPDDAGSSAKGSGAIIGFLDTGIWPESDSFQDKDMGEIPPSWKGTCLEGTDFNSSNCNKKIIGARFYTSEDDEFLGDVDSDSDGAADYDDDGDDDGDEDGDDDDDDDDDYNTPRDMDGHGTHVASTAAGIAVPGASYYGLAEGIAKGGSPQSRIAVYRVCTPDGCAGSSILAAFSDAIADGVDIINLSIGSSSADDYKTNPIAIGAFHAVENGITVVCSAGNSGPNLSSVVNDAPWILTVGATTIDRDFESDVVLGGKKVIKGEAINFADFEKSPVYPLIYAKSAKKSNVNEESARNCNLDSLDPEKVRSKIVVCEQVDDETSQVDEVFDKGGKGLIIVNEVQKGAAFIFNDLPTTMISSKDAAEILSYINSTENPVATILPTTVVSGYEPAPAIADFSSRGPSKLAKNILKPDIVAPGVNILAAWIVEDYNIAPIGKQPPLFNLLSGTSMSSPHVSGLAAAIKSQYPKWSPSAIRSAIMTTASQRNNMRTPITTETGAEATPYDYGAGEMSSIGAMQPGLVYETTTLDYLNFLCYYGYDTSTIALIATAIPKGFSCPKESNVDLISNINYPSIAVFNLTENQPRIITRTLTNVAGDGATTYSSSMIFPAGLNVDVSPRKLQFTKNGKRLSYKLKFSANGSPPLQGDVFGSITWTNGQFKVRSPFVVGMN